MTAGGQVASGVDKGVHPVRDRLAIGSGSSRGEVESQKSRVGGNQLRAGEVFIQIAVDLGVFF